MSFNLDIRGFDEITETMPEIHCKDFIPLQEGAPTMLISGGGVGKSYAAMRIAIEYSLETGRKSALWLSEDFIGVTRHRFDAVCEEFYPEKINTLKKLVKLICHPVTRLTKLENNNAVITKDFIEIRLSLFDYGLVVIDPLIQFNGCDENSNTHAGVLMGEIKEWAADERKCILLVHHVTVTENNIKARGASEWVNGCRAVYRVGKAEGYDSESSLKFTLTKNNGIAWYFRNEKGELERTLKIFPPWGNAEEKKEAPIIHKMSFANHNSVSPDGFIAEDISYFYDLHQKLTSGKAYSQYEFKNGYRLGANNIGSATVICLDFDDGSPTLEEAKRKFSGIKSLILTTRSHQKSKGAEKPACDRFRVIIPLNKPLAIPVDQYSDFLNVLYAKIGAVDPSTKDTARFFFASPEDAVYHYSDSEKLMDWQPIYDKMIQDNIRRKLEKKLTEEKTIRATAYQGKGKPTNTLPKDTIIESRNGSTTLETLRLQLGIDEKYPCKCIDGIDHGGLGSDHLSAFVKKDSSGNVFYSCSGGRCASKGTLWCEE